MICVFVNGGIHVASILRIGWSPFASFSCELFLFLFLLLVEGIFSKSVHSVVVCLYEQGLNALAKNRKENKLICIFVVQQTRELINTAKHHRNNNKNLNNQSVIQSWLARKCKGHQRYTLKPCFCSPELTVCWVQTVFNGGSDCFRWCLCAELRLWPQRSVWWQSFDWLCSAVHHRRGEEQLTRVVGPNTLHILSTSNLLSCQRHSHLYDTVIPCHCFGVHLPWTFSLPIYMYIKCFFGGVGWGDFCCC